jgi:hypothetical protein
MDERRVERPLTHYLKAHDAVLRVEPEDDKALPHLAIEEALEPMVEIRRATDVGLFTRRDFGVEGSAVSEPPGDRGNVMTHDCTVVS